MTPARALREAERFNAACPVGTPVRFWPGLRTGPGTVGRVRSGAVVMSDHASCWVEGQASSINLSHVAPLGDRPVLFQPPMVRAILRGTKTQTRRLVKVPRWGEAGTLEEGDDGPLAVACASGCLADVPCPYGLPGDALWVRETWAHRADLRCLDPGPHAFLYAADAPGGRYHHDDNSPLAWRPSIFMPRAAARIHLAVTDVRVERLHALSIEDAAAEGMASYWHDLDMAAARRDGNLWERFARRHGWESGSPDWRGLYAALWDRLNAGTWDANPLVWVVTFRRVAPVDDVYLRERWR